MELSPPPRFESALFLGALALMVMAGAGCSDNSDPAGSVADTASASAPKTAEPSAETKTIWSMIDSYKTWTKFPENPSLRKSATHEGMFVVSYANQAVAGAQSVPLADGAIIVKENFAKETDTDPMALTIMAKRGSDWYWIKAMPDGKVLPRCCVVCQRARARAGDEGHWTSPGEIGRPETPVANDRTREGRVVD